MFVKLLIQLAVCISHTCYAKYTYHGEKGPEHWGEIAEVCETGKRQSPISFPLEKLVEKKFPLFEFSPDLKKSALFRIVNNGKTVLASIIDRETKENFWLKGGGLPGDVYYFVNMHIHFGTSPGIGSEHTLSPDDNSVKSYSAELHLVFKNGKYKEQTNTEAAEKSDGFAVVGFWVTEEAVATKDLDYFSQDVLAEVAGYEDEKILNLTLDDYIPKRRSGFFRYNGSFTTPNCNEAVTWTVLHEVLHVTPIEMSRLRNMKYYEKDGDEITAKSIADNYRPTVPLNGRTVYTSDSVPKNLFITSGASLSALVSSFSLVIIFCHIL